MSLFYQLLKNSTTVSHKKELDDLFSSVISDGENVIEIYKLTSISEIFPTEIADSETDIAYMGLSKLDEREDIRYVEFTHEIEGCDGIIEPFIESSTAPVGVFLPHQNPRETPPGQTFPSSTAL